MINEYINNVCDILDIAVPVVSFDTSGFTTSTMMAQCSPSGDKIFLKKYDDPNPDQLFAIAHELRHVWQMQNDKQMYLSGYKPAELCGSVEEYNLQLAEIDANAFAGFAMIRFFGLTPLFNGVPDSVKSKIRKRMEKIADEFN